MNQPLRAVRCGRCGIFYHQRYEKCPRCRGRDPRPLSEAGATRLGMRAPQTRGRRPAARGRAQQPAGGRLAPRAIAATGAVFILLLAGWTWPSPSSEPDPVTQSGGGPLAALLRTKQPRRAVVRDRVPGELPFIEPEAIGKLAYAQGDLEGALEHFTAEIGRRPSDAEPHSNAGQVLIRMGRPFEALPFLEKAVALDETRWAYRFNLARCRGLLGEWNRAVEDYQAADVLFPNDYATLFNLGQALHRAGREEEAVRRYREAIELNPGDPTFLLALGISEDQLGRHAEAAAAYRQFLEASPGAKEASGVRLRAEKLEATTVAAAPPAS